MGSSFYSRRCRLRSRRRRCRRSAGAAHKRRTALRCPYGESAGTGTVHAATHPYSAPSVSRRRRAARSGQDRPRGAQGAARQRERESKPRAKIKTPRQNTNPRKSKPYKNQTPRESPPKPTQTTGPHKRLVASRNSVGTVHARLTFGAEKSSHKQPLGGHCHMVFPAPSVKCLCGEERCLWNSD